LLEDARVNVNRRSVGIVGILFIGINYGISP
jgi:hypothetical protein